MKENLKSYDEKIKLYNCGVWNENQQMEYGLGSSDNESRDAISVFKTEKSKNNNIQNAEVVKLDDILKDEKVTFIKMDIEGSEYNALLGAEIIIKENKPRLAICVYHKTSDFWQIPLLLKNINNEYRFILRHHSKYNCSESVLYVY